MERQRGNYERAKTLGMQSIALSREMEDKWQLAAVAGWVGLLAFWSGDEHGLAEGFLKEALALDRELGNWAYGAYCLEGFAGSGRGEGARGSCGAAVGGRGGPAHQYRCATISRCAPSLRVQHGRHALPTR